MTVQQVNKNAEKEEFDNTQPSVSVSVIACVQKQLWWLKCEECAALISMVCKSKSEAILWKESVQKVIIGAI